MSNITTKEIKTKGGTVAILKTQITYGDNEDILDCYRQDKEKVSAKDMLRQADKVSFEKVVVSLNGSSKDLYQTFLNLPLVEAREITVELKKVLDPKGDDPKAEPKL